VAIKQLEDRIEIAEVLMRYGRALDHDVTLWDKVFTPDAELNYPVRDSDRQVRNDERQIRTAAEMGESLARPFVHNGTVSQHLVGNWEIDVSGDTATARSEARVLACIPIPASGNLEITDRIVVFDDELARTPDGWRITRRYLTVKYHDTRVQYVYTG
jgi:hypothetical protein